MYLICVSLHFNTCIFALYVNTLIPFCWSHFGWSQAMQLSSKYHTLHSMLKASFCIVFNALYCHGFKRKKKNVNYKYKLEVKMAHD